MEEIRGLADDEYRQRGTWAIPSHRHSSHPYILTDYFGPPQKR